MPKQEPEGLLDFGRAAHRVKGRGVRISMAERLRAARRIPQAIVKVTSFSHGLRQVGDHLRYITRKGALELENENGEFLRGEESRKELAQDWSEDFEERKRSRDTANIVFSMPPGSDVYALRAAVRATGTKTFQGHEWVFAIHEDRDHPHAHMIVKMRGESEKKLRLRKPDLYQLRETFAAAARDQGVQLAVSPRAARGIGRKPQRQSIYHLRKRGVTPQIERSAIRDLTKELNAGSAPEQPWEKAIHDRYQSEKSAYFAEAQTLKHEAARRDVNEREKLTQAAADLEQFARSMPQPQTRRQAWIERLKQHFNKQGHSKESDKDQSLQPGQ